MTTTREQVIQMAGKSGMLDMIDDEYVRSAVWVAAAERFVADIAQAARAQALDDAKAACNFQAERWRDDAKVYAAHECARAVQALKGKQ
jgi:hypothetical protein